MTWKYKDEFGRVHTTDIPPLEPYVKNYIVEMGCTLQEACNDLGINIDEARQYENYMKVED